MSGTRCGSGVWVAPRRAPSEMLHRLLLGYALHRACNEQTPGPDVLHTTTNNSKTLLDYKHTAIS